MRLFTLNAYDAGDDGYELSLDIAEGIPADVVKKTANELVEMLNSVSDEDFPSKPGDVFTREASDG